MKALRPIGLLCLLGFGFAQDKPSPSLEPLGFLLGDWQAKYSRKGTDGKDEAVAASVHTRWRLQGELLEIEETQTVAGKASMTLLLVAYDAEEKAFKGQAINSSFPSVPMALKGTFAGSKLTLTMEDPLFGGGSFTYERIDDSHYRSSSVIKAGEQEFTESAEYAKMSKA